MTFPPERRGAAFGIWGAVAGLATIAGPTLGGLLVTAFDWRWIFFVNLPIGIAVLSVTFFIIPRFQPGRRHRFDILGVVLASLALLAICYGLVEGQRYDWGTVTSFISIPLIIAAGVVLLAVFFLVQKLRQEREPLIPFALFRNRNFTLMNWVSCTLSIGMLGIFLPFTIYLQSALGFSALKAGLTLAPSSLVMIFVAPFLGKLTDKTGGKYILICGLTLFAVGMGWVVLIATPHSTWYDFLPALIVAGLGMGGTFAPLTTVAMREVDPRMAGAASGVLNTTRQVGSVIGTAAVGALLQNRLVASLTSQASIRSAGLPAPVREHFVSGFRQSAASGVLTGGPAGSAPGGTPGGPGGARGAAAPARRRGLHQRLRARDAVDHAHADRRRGPGRGQLLCHQEQAPARTARGGRRAGRSDGRDHQLARLVRLAGPEPGQLVRDRPRSGRARTGTGPRTPAPGR